MSAASDRWFMVTFAQPLTEQQSDWLVARLQEVWPRGFGSLFALNVGANVVWVGDRLLYIGGKRSARSLDGTLAEFESSVALVLRDRQLAGVEASRCGLVGSALLSRPAA